MSKTFPSIELRRFATPGHRLIKPLGIKTIGLNVWNFEFGAWNFRVFH